jgi:hypothetical protein
MSPLIVHFLRRVALLAVVLAVLAGVGPRLLRELGLAGPRVPELIEGAERSLAAARQYGADDGMPSMQEANRRLAEARSLAGRGEGRSARHAAEEASAAAIVAQGQALARHERQRRQSAAIANDIDRTLNLLEELYGRVSHGLDKATAATLLSRLKSARQTGAVLILANEQGNYGRVIAEEAETRKTLDAAREEIAAAGRPTPGLKAGK